MAAPMENPSGQVGLPSKTTKRRTSKLWLAANSFLAWVAIFYALYTQQGAVVVAALVGLIMNYSAYVLVGHWDFAQTLRHHREAPMDLSKYTGVE